MWTRWTLRVGIGAALMATGAGLTYLLMRTPEAGPPVLPDSPHEPTADTGLTLSEEARKRAGIETGAVAARKVGAEVRVPGVIEPNGYRTVAVKSLVNGRIVEVSAELGDSVARGQVLATIFSPELSEAQTRFLSAKAELEYGRNLLQRTERLVQIGAASQQELEEVRATHTRHETELESAGARLRLLGLDAEQIGALTSPEQVSAAVPVPAPLRGVVIRRNANPGLVVEPETELFTVADLSTVWVIGSVYERDIPSVEKGSPAALTAPGFPETEIRGRVDYVDPQIDEETRTAKVRVEAPNERGRLRLGMYVDLRISGAETGESLVVPNEAIQLLGSRTVVYLVDSAKDVFVERDVVLGRRLGADMEVLEGLKAGDIVVTRGSFYIRAERERRTGATADSPSHAH